VKDRVKKLAKDLLRASTGRLGDAFCSPSTKLVIFSRGRTGSHLLVSLLASHPKVRQHAEIFGEYYLKFDFIRNEINKMGAVSYFDHTTRRIFTEQVVAVKFLYYQLEPEYAHRWNVPDMPSLLPVLKERKDLRIVHLKRRNRLATLISWKLAHQTRRWKHPGHDRSSKGHSAEPKTTVNLSYDECEQEFAQTERWQQSYDAAFAGHPFVDMYYEDLVMDRRAEMARVLQLLDLEDCELQTPLRKQNTRTIEDTLENFPELRQRFADTPYADFFATTAT
jgi:LPS sulfotransferase NodH